MTRPAIAHEVAGQLEGLCRSGGPIHPGGGRATVNTFTEAQLVARGAKIGGAFMQRQTHVATDGRAAIVTAGPPGSGKSTALSRNGVLDGSFRNIDSDIIKEQLIELALSEGTFDDLLRERLADGRDVRPMELASLVHRESTRIASNLMAVSLRNGENIIVQGTLAWDGQPRSLLDELEKNEYVDLTIFDVEVDLDIAIDRSLSRWWLGRIDESDLLGGRYMPRYMIEALYLPGGATKCSMNADVMLGLSDIIPTTLRRTSEAFGVMTETVQVKGAGTENDSITASKS